jgi:N-acetylglucosaminyldiphosphoundecaprenol N-acetyl-beta-D-mannosaminyltransferase
MFGSPAMARLLAQQDTQVMIDGMPIVMAGRLKGLPLTRQMRVTSLDFYDRMFTVFRDKGWKVGYLGASPEVLERGLAELRQRIPGLDIDGRDGFFDMADDSPGSRQAEILDWLNQRSHDMVIVGMGMPRQEEWIERVQHRIPTRVLVPTGAYLDYQVGEQTLPPRWMGRAGLEGVYRLFRSPRRLAYRYLLEPLVLAWRLIARPHPQKGGA